MARAIAEGRQAEKRGTGVICTIGYEGSVLDDVLDRLVGAGVELLIDVRAVPQSRKPGFSKTLLGASLEARGIEYRHLRWLGTPKAGRIAARAGRGDEMRAIFAAHMQGEDAQAGLAEAVNLARAAPACLLCFEREPHLCHRAILADAISATTGQKILNL